LRYLRKVEVKLWFFRCPENVEEDPRAKTDRNYFFLGYVQERKGLWKGSMYKFIVYLHKEAIKKLTIQGPEGDISCASIGTGPAKDRLLDLGL
jgi:hypothetical protein